MAFDQRIHIKDHAELIIDNLVINENEEDFVHFTCSVDTALLISKGYDTQEKIDNLMKEMLINISKSKHVVAEQNGTYTNKNGDVIRRKPRKRTIGFDKILSAYHNRHFDDSKRVNSHYHFLGNQNARLGKNFIYLKKAIEIEAEKFGITFHFSDTRRETGLTKSQEKSIKTMSWIFNEGKTKKIETYLKDDDKLGKVLDLLHTHYVHSENISYFIKTINIVNQRLHELGVDYWYKNINLKNSICFSLTSEQEDKIKALNNEEVVELDMTKVFDREVLKYAYGFGSDSMSVLVDRFDMPTINKNKLEVISKNDDNNGEPKSKSNFRNLVLVDIKNAIDNSWDEKSLKEALLDMGYQKTSFKTAKNKDKKRIKTGMAIVTPKGMKLTMNFLELGMSWADITSILMANQKKKKKSEKITSKTEGYRRKEIKKDDNLTLYEYRVRQLLVIYSKENIKTNIVHNLASKFKVSRSAMYDITTFTSDDSTIVDYADKVVLKKSSSLKEDVTDMLELAELKGWLLSSLTIRGSRRFKEEAQRQINKRIGIRKGKGVISVKNKFILD